MNDKERPVVIVLASEVPYPPNTGGSVMIYNRLRALSAIGCRIHLIIVDKGELSERSEAALNMLCQSVYFYSRASISKLKILFDYLVRGLPYAVCSRTFKEIKSVIRSLTSIDDVDALFVEYPQLMRNLPDALPGLRLILEEQNIEWESMNSLADAEPRQLIKLLRKIEARRLLQFETGIMRRRKIDAVTFLTQKDLTSYPDDFICEKRLMPPTVGSVYSSWASRDKDRVRVLLVGNFTYKPNIDGAIWLIKQVMPLVWEQRPDVRVDLVGKQPPVEIKNLADRRVNVTGTVPEVGEYYRACSCVVSPIFSGGGIKMKMIEAISSNRPVVATSFAEIGLGLVDGESFICADSPEEFAKGIIACLENGDFSKSIAQGAREKYLAVFSEKATQEALRELISMGSVAR